MAGTRLRLLVEDFLLCLSCFCFNHDNSKTSGLDLERLTGAATLPTAFISGRIASVTFAAHRGRTLVTPASVREVVLTPLLLFILGDGKRHLSYLRLDFSSS